MKKIIFISLLSLVPTISNAAGESCNTLLNLGLYNVTQGSSASDAQALSLSTFCSADYSSSSTSSSTAASIEASYGLVSGGGGYSGNRQDVITKQSQLCKGGFNSSHYSANASDYSKTVYQGSLDAWNKCQELANKGLVFNVQPSSSLQGVSVSITAPTGVAVIFYGVTQFGSGKSLCTTMANGKVLNVSTSKPFKFTAASKVTISCARQMQANGQDLSADEQDLIFVTSMDNLSVPLKAIGNFSKVTADSIIGSLSGAIAAFNLTSCPNGWRPADGTNGTIDLRGEFLRGLDNNRGVDNGRVLASWQAPTLTTAAIGPDALHQFVIEGNNANLANLLDFNDGMQTDSIADSWYGSALKGNIYVGSVSAYSNNSAGRSANQLNDRPLNNNSAILYGGTRPRNVAMLYCVKN